MVSSEACGMNPIMKMVATAPSAKAIGMPENKMIRVAPPYSRPICSVVIVWSMRGACLVGFAGKGFAGQHLQQEDERKERHADRHAAIRDPQRSAPCGAADLAVFHRIDQQRPGFPAEK